MPPHRDVPSGDAGSTQERVSNRQTEQPQRRHEDSADWFKLSFDHSSVPQAIVAADGALVAANAAFRSVVDVDAMYRRNGSLDSTEFSFSALLSTIDFSACSGASTELDLETRDGTRAKLRVDVIGNDSEIGPIAAVTFWHLADSAHAVATPESELGQERAARRDAEISVDLIERLLGITDVALAHIELHDLLNELLGRIRDVLKTDEASILLTDPDGDALSLRVSLHPDQLVRRPIRVPIGVGFAGRIAQTRVPMVLDDVSEFRFSNPAMLRRGVRSLMGVPMILDHRVLGVIHVGMRSPRHFDDGELRLLELAAARISLAVDRSNLYEAERLARAAAERAQRRDEFLARASEILSSSLDQKITLGHATQIAVPEIGDICTVVLIDRDGIVRLVAGTATADLRHLLPPAGEKLPRPLSECPTISRLVESGETLLIEDGIEEFLAEISAGDDHLRDLHCAALKSAMRLPLKSGGRVIGVITFCLASEDRNFTAADVALAEDFAHVVALATDNTTHYMEAQRAIGARDEFISIASHELKTPLTTVKGYVQLLRRHLNESTPDHERVVRTLGQLQDQVGRFEELVDELLDVSRIQSDRIRLNYERFDLSYLVSQVIDRVAQAHEQQSPHMVEYAIPGPIWGSWDASRIDQVVTNVLSNAFKYSPAESTVTVEVSADDEKVEIRITDQGIGVAEKDVEVILQPFARGTGASEVAQGAGLGLYISNEIVVRHGGSLSIESCPGAGSTFSICLPREPGDDPVGG